MAMGFFFKLALSRRWNYIFPNCATKSKWAAKYCEIILCTHSIWTKHTNVIWIALRASSASENIRIRHHKTARALSRYVFGRISLIYQMRAAISLNSYIPIAAATLSWVFARPRRQTSHILPLLRHRQIGMTDRREMRARTRHLHYIYHISAADHTLRRAVPAL